MAEMGLFEATHTARALRRFKPDPVPDEVLARLIDAGVRAPTGSNLQNWRFVIVTILNSVTASPGSMARPWKSPKRSWPTASGPLT